jgi:hypothetical protein
MADSSLGSMNFVSLSGVEAPSQPPPTLKETVLPIQRHGVPGTAFILTGEKGEPFQMLGFAVFDTLQTAEAAEYAYKAMIGADKYLLTWAGDPITTNLYVVISVRILRCQKCGVSSSGDGAFSESLWTLCAVAND